MCDGKMTLWAERKPLASGNLPFSEFNTMIDKDRIGRFFCNLLLKLGILLLEVGYVSL